MRDGEFHIYSGLIYVSTFALFNHGNSLRYCKKQ